MIRNVALTYSPVESDCELLNKDAVNVQQGALQLPIYGEQTEEAGSKAR
jgi:hypothetical protein